MTLVETLRMAGRHAPIDENVFDQAADEIENKEIALYHANDALIKAQEQIAKLQAELEEQRAGNRVLWEQYQRLLTPCQKWLAGHMTNEELCGVIDSYGMGKK